MWNFLLCNGMGFVLVLVEYGSWFLFVFHFCLLFLVCKIGDRGAVVRFIGGYFRYSFALLSSLNKSEASGVVRPVRVVLFLSGWYFRASCR